MPERQRFWMRFARSYGFQPDNGALDGDTSSGREQANTAVNDPENVFRAELLRRAEFKMLNEGVTHYVSMDMADLVTQAARLAEPEPLFPTDLPCPSGIAVLEAPLIINDLHPQTGVVDERIQLPVRAIGWQQMRMRPNAVEERLVDGIYLFLYTDSKAYETIHIPSLQAIGEALSADLDGPPEWTTPLIPIEANPWAFGKVWVDAGDTFTSVDPTRIISTVAFSRRWALSFFRLMWQRILNPEPWAPPRADRRRVDRAGWRRNAEATDVKVLRLRRIATDVDDPTTPSKEHGWTLDHRIAVRGHWRRQFYRSLGEVGDPAAYRLIWIDPFIKGPEGTPIVLKHNLTALVR